MNKTVEKKKETKSVKVAAVKTEKVSTFKKKKKLKKI